MSRPVLAYVAACCLLGVLAFVWPVSTAAFWVLVVLTLPGSIPAYFLTYAGGVLLFGADDWSVVEGIAIAGFWTAVASAQAAVTVSIWRARRVDAVT